MLNAASDGLTREQTLAGTLIVRVCLCLSIIISGLALRGFGHGLGLPPAIVKYGGSVLWGTMVFFLVAIAAPGQSRLSIALISASIAVCMELFRLVHAPWLDAFRLTIAGALLLGRIFSPWNMLAYGFGIVFGMLLDRFGVPVFSNTRPAVRDAPLIPPAETAQNGAALPRCGASNPCARLSARRCRPSSISASAISGSCDRS
jgi:hypothetical protein